MAMITVIAKVAHTSPIDQRYRNGGEIYECEESTTPIWAVSMTADHAKEAPDAPPETPPPSIGVSPSSLIFTASEGGNNPANQSITLSNIGGGTLNWILSSDSTWITANPLSGNGGGSITVDIEIGALPAGIYIGALIIVGGLTVQPMTVPITLTILAAPIIPPL